LYFQKYFVHENRLRVRIRKLLESPGEPVETEALNALMDEIFSLPLTLRTAPGGNPISRDIHQVEAIMLALTRKLSIISGGPGTGKTSLMVNILRCLWRLGVKPSNTVVCAPTGRAAQRMTEALHKNLQTILNPGPADHALSSIFADTIHRALKFRTLSNDFTYGLFNPLPADIVIVDEVSMVDVVLMEKLMSAIDPETTRVILLGDKDQLPSVEAGAVLAQIVPESADEKTVSGHLAILKTVFRSDRHIQDLADAVNRGEIPQHVPQNSLADTQDHSPHPWRVIGFSSVSRLNQDLMDWLSRRFLQPFDILEEPEASKRPGNFKTGELPGTNPAFADLIALAGSLSGEQLTDVSKGHDILERLFHVVESSRILTLVRKGPTGCEAINRLASRFLGGRFQKSSRITDGAFSGAVIMVTRNDYSRSLFNGDIGLVIRGRQGGDRAYFRRGDGFISFPSDTLPAWESAFATTVHKSQGSEFDEVLVVLPREPTHRILSREIIYTAITRAKKRVFIYGDPEVLRTAVRRKIVRRSGMD
jgi:exodeoxyribonuclease V alpha subunit